VKNKFICFAVNTLKQAEETIKEANKNNIKPIIFIKYYIVKGFGVDWIKTLQLLLASSFSQNSFKLYVDANTDYGLSIELISIKINYIKLRCNHKIIKKINQIAKKNKVLLNPSFRIVDLSNLKNISRKISTI
tara:strand:- start:112 stop:510 length:399 start_codon:yes stop_codon:yes gene_type:complete